MGSKPGERRGGRKAGTPNKATAEVKILAQKHGPEAIRIAAKLMKSAESETARLAAANIILDRAYGKASQPMEHTGKDGGPIETKDVSDATRARALAAFMAKTRGQ